jgi:hypothetical protein
VNPDQIAHRHVSSFHDEDWTALCACGAARYAYLRGDAEKAIRDHIDEEGLKAIRAALEGEQ